MARGLLSPQGTEHRETKLNCGYLMSLVRFTSSHVRAQWVAEVQDWESESLCLVPSSATGLLCSTALLTQPLFASVSMAERAKDCNRAAAQGNAAKPRAGLLAYHHVKGANHCQNASF